MGGLFAGLELAIRSMAAGRTAENAKSSNSYLLYESISNVLWQGQ